ncbi:MAG: hypothetical protein MUC61_00415 [Amoebophilaceae bacterium]|jgi:hypothetical protein|nr:hypothetical protein [Amoebophilaceae bacterium]
MSCIKEKILSLYTKRLIKSCRIARTNVGFQQAQNIGILYSADTSQKHEVIHYLATRLKNMGKQVTILCYTKVPTQTPHCIFPTITHHDLPLWGAIAHPKTRAFVNASFDYLFHVDLSGHPMLDYLLAKSHAKCRVGRYDTARTNLFEIMVKFDKRADSNAIDDLVAQMLHYTQLLQVP